jgi:hypothetical protein
MFFSKQMRLVGGQVLAKLRKLLLIGSDLVPSVVSFPTLYSARLLLNEKASSTSTFLLLSSDHRLIITATRSVSFIDFEELELDDH